MPLTTVCCTMLVIELPENNTPVITVRAQNCELHCHAPHGHRYTRVEVPSLHTRGSGRSRCSVNPDSEDAPAFAGRRLAARRRITQRHRRGRAGGSDANPRAFRHWRERRGLCRRRRRRPRGPARHRVLIPRAKKQRAGDRRCTRVRCGGIHRCGGIRCVYGALLPKAGTRASGRPGAAGGRDVYVPRPESLA